MRTIALETSTRDGSVALLCAGDVIAMHPLPPDRRTAEVLAPVIRDSMARVGWRPTDLRLVAVTNGPGSFTGLRIAVTTAKTLAYAVGAKLVAVNTLDVIVRRLPRSCQSAAVVMNAQRGQWFAATYRRAASEDWKTTQACRLVDRRTWLESLAPGTVLTGPTADRFAGTLPAGVQLADTTLWLPRADVLGRLAWQRYQAGLVSDLWTLTPQYYRPSYAEEKKATTHKDQIVM